MEIPPEISIPICIEQGTVYHYRLDITNRDGSFYSGDRFFIVLNVNPKTDEILVLTTMTTQIRKQRQYIKIVGEDPETLVFVSPADFLSLSERSVVNCNNIYQITMADLIAKIKNGGKTFVQKLPRTVVSALVSGVMKSRQVSADIKKMLI